MRTYNLDESRLVVVVGGRGGGGGMSSWFSYLGLTAVFDILTSSDNHSRTSVFVIAKHETLRHAAIEGDSIFDSRALTRFLSCVGHQSRTPLPYHLRLKPTAGDSGRRN